MKVSNINHTFEDHGIEFTFNCDDCDIASNAFLQLPITPDSELFIGDYKYAYDNDNDAADELIGILEKFYYDSFNCVMLANSSALLSTTIIKIVERDDSYFEATDSNAHITVIKESPLCSHYNIPSMFERLDEEEKYSLTII